MDSASLPVKTEFDRLLSHSHKLFESRGKNRSFWLLWEKALARARGILEAQPENACVVANFLSVTRYFEGVAFWVDTDIRACLDSVALANEDEFGESVRDVEPCGHSMLSSKTENMLHFVDGLLTILPSAVEKLPVGELVSSLVWACQLGLQNSLWWSPGTLRLLSTMFVACDIRPFAKNLVSAGNLVTETLVVHCHTFNLLAEGRGMVDDDAALMPAVSSPNTLAFFRLALQFWNSLSTPITSSPKTKPSKKASEATSLLPFVVDLLLVGHNCGVPGLVCDAWGLLSTWSKLDPSFAYVASVHDRLWCVAQAHIDTLIIPPLVGSTRDKGVHLGEKACLFVRSVVENLSAPANVFQMQFALPAVDALLHVIRLTSDANPKQTDEVFATLHLLARWMSPHPDAMQHMTLGLAKPASFGTSLHVRALAQELAGDIRELQRTSRQKRPREKVEATTP